MSDGSRPQPFRLTRFFSIACLCGMVLVTACLLWLHREHTRHHLVEQGGRANADLARAFANTVWGSYRPLVVGAPGRSRAQLLADPLLPGLDAQVRQHMRGLAVVKVKIYDRHGLTVFSTDPVQIGQSQAGNADFQRAMAGVLVSSISHRDRFDSMDGQIAQRNLIATYVPMSAKPGTPPEAVFELYTDVTELMKDENEALSEVSLAVLGLLGGLYLFLLGMVRKADRHLAAQEQARAHQAAKVHHLAYHDTLTGLPNRSGFAACLDQAVAGAAAQGHTAALMFIDLDRFKAVNDSLGHAAGDEVLKVVAARIQGCLRDGGQLFRMGGDEFTALLPAINGPEEVDTVARRIQAVVAQPVALQAHLMSVGASIGIALYPADGRSAEALLKNADAAMYSAKTGGHGTHAFYQPAMNARADERLALEEALHKALRDDEFELVYQPRLDAGSGRVVALEAMLRWAPPGRPALLPAQFLSVLEETGLINAVGDWVLQQACRQLAQWQRDGAAQGRAPVPVAVNLAPAQLLHAGLAERVDQALQASGATPQRLILELPEALLAPASEATSRVLDALRALGVHLAVQNFGIGCSSLAGLRQQALDSLHLDRSLVATAATHPADRALVLAIHGMARSMGMSLVAVGVETEAQARFFAGIGGVAVQGHLFCGALAPDALAAWLAERERTAALAHDGLAQAGAGADSAAVPTAAAGPRALALPPA